MRDDTRPGDGSNPSLVTEKRDDYRIGSHAVLPVALAAPSAKHNASAAPNTQQGETASVMEDDCHVAPTVSP